MNVFLKLIYFYEQESFVQQNNSDGDCRQLSLSACNRRGGAVSNSTQFTSGGYWAAARDNANFRNLWLGQIISLLGDWFNLIASATLIAQLTESGLAVGTLFVVRMLAPVLVSPLAGVAADRYNRKHILIAADVGRFFTAAAFLLIRSPEHVWFVYLLSFLQLGIGGFFFPARSALLPDIVRSDQVGAANALTSATWSVMLATGAAPGGFVAGTWGIYPSFVIDALSFVLSALILSRIRLRFSLDWKVTERFER